MIRIKKAGTSPIVEIKLKQIADHFEKIELATLSAIDIINLKEDISDKEKEDLINQVKKDVDAYKKLYVGKDENGNLPSCHIYEIQGSMPDGCNADHVVGRITRFATACSGFQEYTVQEEADEMLALFGIKKKEKQNPDEDELINLIK